MKLTITDKTALVLEGGGMRGVFTCGILDYFILNNINFPYVVGVSAGAINGISYISKQFQRAKKTNIDLLEKYKYMNFRNLLLTGNYVNDKIVYGLIPDKVLPFDFDTYSNNPTIFETVSTNCISGEAEYFTEKKDKNRTLDLIRSSSRLPFVSPFCYINNIPYLDGGIVDSIPLKRAIDKGYDDNTIVILTKPKGYRKKVNKMRFARIFYHKYPNLHKALSIRYKVYNQQLEYVEELEKAGKIIVFRPSGKNIVGRTEKNTKKMNALYDEGFNFLR